MSSTNQTPPDSSTPVRVMLISTPRSVSTALMKCMSCIKGSLVFLEPYLLACWFGKDKKFDNPFEGFIQPDDIVDVLGELEATNIDYGYEVTETSYSWCKTELEKEYPQKKLIFCKEISHSIRDHYDDLPIGFRYIFLIRNPMLVFPSWKKMQQKVLRIPMEDLNLNRWTEAMIPQCKGSVYEEMCNQFEFVKKNRDPNPIVIDAEDLLGNPAKILKTCFEQINMPYSDSILQWDSSDSVTRDWVVATSCLQVNKVAGMYNEAIESGNFFAPKQLPNPNDLTEDERHFAQDGMPFYERLYENRIE
ncbi:uncharacterized protein [Amphiura filiformis]|uniref:uncharacterized protein n=1 Tax=Amphiura filiformis TaxID=82378 RepID=UPI003B21320E